VEPQAVLKELNSIGLVLKEGGLSRVDVLPMTYNAVLIISAVALQCQHLEHERIQRYVALPQATCQEESPLERHAPS
jgi:hypothetical protein